MMTQKLRIQKLKKSQRGFTLVELMIYMALLAILLTVLTDTFVSIVDLQLESQSTTSVERDGRFLLAKLASDVTSASAITTPASLGGSGSTMTLVINGVSYTYSLSQGNLQLSNSLGTANLNSNETTISNLSFQRLGNSGGKHSIRITFTVTSNIVRRGEATPQTKTFVTAAGLR